MSILQLMLNIVIVWCAVSIPVSLVAAKFMSLSKKDEALELEQAALNYNTEKFSFRRLDEAN